MNPNFDVLEQVLSDFKVPRRKLQVDHPHPIDEVRTNRDKIIEEVINNDYLAFTRNLKIAKNVPLTDEEKTNKNELVHKVYNFDYLSSSDSKTDYDILKEGYEILYAVYLEQKRNTSNVLNDYMKLSVEYSYLKQNIETALSEIKQNIETRKDPHLIIQLEDSASKILNIDIKYIDKLKKAIDSVLLSDKEKRDLLYKLLEIE
jgi:hypothetical protein